MTPGDDSPALRELSAAIREKADYHAAPASLIAAVRNALPPDEPARPLLPPRRAWLRQAAALAGAAFAGALLTWGATTYLRDDSDRIARDLLDAHIQATLGNRLIDVASSDQHTVKPWLSAHLPFSPAVADYSAQGFELRGGRIDHIGGRAVAVLVYARRKHVIDAFVWPADLPGGTPADITRNGFRVESFAAGGMRYALVSDLNRNELHDLAKLLAQDAAR
jgi:anti-sigma factor RsiW